MGKPHVQALLDFKKIFMISSKRRYRSNFSSYYFIAAHSVITEDNMTHAKTFTTKALRTNPQQVQIFTPLPSTYSSLMYFTQTDASTGGEMFVEKKLDKKQRQKDMVVRTKIK
jgi:hypothetical protein